MDANEIISSVSERVRDTANVRAVFGEPVQAPGGVTIIPVATIKVGGGGGGGTGEKGEGGQPSGSGAGRGLGLGLRVVSVPLGYIEVKQGEAKFVPVPDVTKIAVGGMAVATLSLLTGMKMLRFLTWRKRLKMMRWQKMNMLRRKHSRNPWSLKAHA